METSLQLRQREFKSGSCYSREERAEEPARQSQRAGTAGNYYHPEYTGTKSGPVPVQGLGPTTKARITACLKPQRNQQLLKETLIKVRGEGVYPSH